MEFLRNGIKLDINEQHYEPTFIASNVDELSNNQDARKILRDRQLLTLAEDKIPEETEVSKKASEEKKSNSTTKKGVSTRS